MLKKKEINYVVVGGLCVDSIISDNGEEKLYQFGGNAAYGATGARIWAGDGVGLVARIGLDYPRDWIDKLKNAHIDIKGVREISKPHTLGGGMIYDGKGNRRGSVSIKEFKINSNEQAAEFTGYSNERWHQAQLDFGGRASDIPDNYSKAKAVLLAPRYYENQMGCIEYYKRKSPGTLLILDPGEWYLDPSKMERIRMLFSAVDVILPSEAEVRLLFGEMDLEQAARRLAEIGPKIVVIKVGRQGCIVYEKDRDTITRLPVFSVPVRRDTTGAGDSFCGGFLVGFHETGDPLRAAMYGTVSSSFIIEGFGADYSLCVTREMAEERYESLKQQILLSKAELTCRLNSEAST